MQKLEAAAPTLPVYDGELYLELHRGTLTAKQQIKKNNRMAENLLRMLELCLTRSAVATHTPGGRHCPAPAVEYPAGKPIPRYLARQLHCRR